MCCNVLCCFGFLSLCGCKNYVIRGMVFFPPEPSSYGVRTIKSSKQTANGEDLKSSERHSLLRPKLNHRRDMVPQTENVFYLRMADGTLDFPVYKDNISFYYLTTRRNKLIGSCMAWCPRARCTILFAHGNATDLGLMREQLMHIRSVLGVNVFAFDYTGYGVSNGQPTVKDTYVDAEAAYDFITKRLGINSNSIVGYGQSLGSGVIAHLAGKRKLKGLILHSPLMSGLRLVQNVDKTLWFDIYPVVDFVKRIKIPVWILHGTHDQEVPISHGEGVYAACVNPWNNWFVIGGKHNNLENFREEYYVRFDAFLKYLGFQDLREKQ